MSPDFEDLIQLYSKQQNPNCEECRCYALSSELSSGAHFEKNGDSLKKERKKERRRSCKLQRQSRTSLPAVSQQNSFHASLRGCENSLSGITKPSSQRSGHSHPLLRFDCGLSNKSRDNNMTRATMTNDLQGRRATNANGGAKPKRHFGG